MYDKIADRYGIVIRSCKLSSLAEEQKSGRSRTPANFSIVSAPHRWITPYFKIWCNIAHSAASYS